MGGELVRVAESVGFRAPEVRKPVTLSAIPSDGRPAELPHPALTDATSPCEAH